MAHIFEDEIATVATLDEAPVVRPATEADVDGIAEMVQIHARQGHLLPRSPENIRASISTWVVAEMHGRVVGIGSLLTMNPALVEVRSLAVLQDYRRYGLGKTIVLELVEQARRRGIPTVFALTRAVRFFTSIGFEITEKERFPEKVWTDCVVCPLRHACDETAVVRELDVRGAS